jgi:hypothetical protein
MKFHSFEVLKNIHETNPGHHTLRVVVAALIGMAVVAGITMILPFG